MRAAYGEYACRCVLVGDFRHDRLRFFFSGRVHAEQSLLQFGVGRELACRHLARDAAVDHHCDAVGYVDRHADVLFYQQHGNLVTFRSRMRQLLQRRNDLLDNHRRQAFGRLVHHQHARVEQQRAADRQHLLLTARQLGAAVAPAIRQPREQRVDALDRPRALARALCCKPQMLVDRQRCPHAPALRHVADAELGDHVRRKAKNFAPCEFHTAARRNQPGDRIAQRRLAHAVAANDAEHAGMQSQ